MKIMSTKSITKNRLLQASVFFLVALPNKNMLVHGEPSNYAGPTPKMNQEPVIPGKPFGPPPGSEQGGTTKTISSKSSTHLGDCAPGKPFTFPVSGASGRGVIGTNINANVDMVASDDEIKCWITKDHEGPPQEFFGSLYEGPNGIPIDGDNLVSTPFGCDDGTGTSIILTCEFETPIIVVYSDDSNTLIEATLTDTGNGSQRFELSEGKRSESSIRGQTRKKANEQNRSPVSFEKASNTGITIKHDSGNSGTGVALVQVTIANENNEAQPILRTFITETKNNDTPQNRKLKSNQVQCCDITADGDIEMSFPGIASSPVHVHTRLGLKLDNAEVPVGVVDVHAILGGGSSSSSSSGPNKLIVNGGWARRTLSEHGMQGKEDGWDFQVLGLYFTDPSDESQVLGLEGDIVSNSVDASSNNKRNSRRAMLAAAPSQDEKSISSAMKMGRKPKQDNGRKNLRRGLSQGSHNKILVHGYCSSNPWPTSHFTDAVVFDDVDSSGPQNWSHDTFARKIDKFADTNNIDGCGCIAHSQGGTACLHLYTYYWSCLDNPNNSGRMIQSVGTPYQGSAIGGDLAALGQVFGAGCGSNSDLSESGASSWLLHIPSWARSQVSYYTTSFEDKWWRYDYCHLATDLLLGDPEDGAVAKNKGQLSGGQNRGHKTGWCHSTGMRDPPQYQDAGRNSVMNWEAQY